MSQSTPPAEQSAALDIARNLIREGTPVFLAKPCPGASCRRKGHGPGTDFDLPPGWQRTKPDVAVVDQWRPGDALGAVMGVVMDAADFDPRNGTNETMATSAALPTQYALQQTPRGGVHIIVPPLGIGKDQSILSGVDLLSGKPDGTGRGFTFIAPTVRHGKPYRWVVPPALPDPTDTRALWLAKLVESKGGKPPESAVAAPAGEPAPPGRLESLWAAVEAYVTSEPGTGDGALFHLACWVRECANSGWLDLTEALARLDDARERRIDRHPSGGGQDEADWARIRESSATRVRDSRATVRPELEVNGLPVSEHPAKPAESDGNGSEASTGGRDLHHDFSALVAGDRKRARPKWGKRSDGLLLLYPGKEHTLVAETEAGKTMLLTAWTLEALAAHGLKVAVIDFEEGDELEWGTRLRAQQLAGHLLTDPDQFRYFTPTDKSEADRVLNQVAEWRPNLVILDGVSAAYGLYGWQVKENDSATAFRAHVVRPLLAIGAATVSTDHIPKSADGKRYAIGGVMKLNMVNGAAYFLQSYAPIVRGGQGASLLFGTKDRPGSVKPHGTPGKEAGVWRIGTLNVRSGGQEDDSPLEVWVTPQREGDADGDELDELWSKIRTYLEGRPERGYGSRRQLHDSLRAADVRFSNDDVGPALERGRLLGELEIIKAGSSTGGRLA